MSVETIDECDLAVITNALYAAAGDSFKRAKLLHSEAHDVDDEHIREAMLRLSEKIVGSAGSYRRLYERLSTAKRITTEHDYESPSIKSEKVEFVRSDEVVG